MSANVTPYSRFGANQPMGASGQMREIETNFCCCCYYILFWELFTGQTRWRTFAFDGSNNADS